MILPYLKDRPQSLHRHVDGWQGKASVEPVAKDLIKRLDQPSDDLRMLRALRVVGEGRHNGPATSQPWGGCPRAPGSQQRQS